MALPGYPCVVVPTFTNTVFGTAQYTNVCGTALGEFYDGSYNFDGTVLFI